MHRPSQRAISVDRILGDLLRPTPTHCLVLSGGIGSGKTRAAIALAGTLRDMGIPVGGIVAPRVVRAGITVGYRVRDLSTGRERMLVRAHGTGERVGRFSVDAEGIAFARAAIDAAAGSARYVFVDEIGPLELGGRGHAPAIRRLLASSARCVLVVRSALVADVLRTFGIQGARVSRIRTPGEIAAPSPSRDVDGEGHKS